MKKCFILLALMIIASFTVKSSDIPILDRTGTELIKLSFEALSSNEAIITNIECENAYNEGVIDLVIPENVNDESGYPFKIVGIGDSAFSPKEPTNNNLSIKTIILPETIKSIGKNAFENLLNMESIILPEGMDSIGSSAFGNCPKLIGLWLPRSLSYIDNICDGAGNMPKFINLFLGEKVKKIEPRAFTSCVNLENIYLPTEEPPMITNDVFPANVTFYVPEESIEKYKTEWGPNLNNPTFLPHQVSHVDEIMNNENVLKMDLVGKQLNISGDKLNMIKIYDYLGRLVETSKSNNFSIVLPKGLYLIHTNIGNKKVLIK